MNILILGGDGYLGWPTAMYLSIKDNQVTVVDNYSRRNICKSLEVDMLYPVPNLVERAKLRYELTGKEIKVVEGDFEYVSGVKMRKARKIKNFKQDLDVNQKLFEMDNDLPLSQSFAKADNILTVAAKGIAELISLTGYINVDFNDVKTVMTNSGQAIMGSASVSGDNRASEAVRYPPPEPVASPSTLDAGELSKAVPTSPVLYTLDALCPERSPTADDAAELIEESPTVKFK